LPQPPNPKSQIPNPQSPQNYFNIKKYIFLILEF